MQESRAIMEPDEWEYQGTRTTHPDASSNPTPLASNTTAGSISVSSAFNPGALDEISDTVLISSDSVLFYVHSSNISRTQPNAFRRLVGVPLTDAACRDRIIKIDEGSDVVAVMLHALYDRSCYPTPSFESIVAAVDKMRMYEISPTVQLTSTSHLYKLILSFAPVKPLEVFALAGFHRLDGMAVEASTHLISYPLSAITDAMAARIGTTYLLRLFQWRLHRTSEMKRIFLTPLFPHPPTRGCSFEGQRITSQLWAEVSANFGYEDHTGSTTAMLSFPDKRAKLTNCDYPDITLSFLRSLLQPRLQQIDCELCRDVIENKMRNIIVEWNAVPRTIPSSG
ncbi:hypothetical protein NP233_g12218 [Leucocoprinus birnbaumii]|uniref:BTB domain-containing protein n=1 Tax=Leucocoprinus birnbaumii TaxID=56174 RepID=A0AAD5VFD5_9AGAR|nr:hypothetical protein NP233_g12218 [Leucocoprinus birnbaumii]